MFLDKNVSYDTSRNAYVLAKQRMKDIRESTFEKKKTCDIAGCSKYLEKVRF